MKSLALALIVLIAPLAAQAQGTVEFKNFDAATGWNAPVLVYDSRDLPITRLIPASGTSYVVELFGGGPSELNWKIIARTNFLSGAQAGYFDGGVQAIPEVPSRSNAILEIRVWAASFGSFPAAQAAGIGGTWGQSSLFTVATGTSNAPAKLVPFQGLVLTPLTVYPTIYATFNRVNHTIDVTFSGGLEISSDLVKWSDAASNYNYFNTFSIPLDKPSQFFRVH
jgi:hypothetical protein